MKFNSKLKVHIIYHYLEGDWEAISKYFLAGAVFNSTSSEPEGLLSYIFSCCIYVATTPMHGRPHTASFHQERSPIAL